MHPVRGERCRTNHAGCARPFEEAFKRWRVSSMRPSSSGCCPSDYGLRRAEAGRNGGAEPPGRSIRSIVHGARARFRATSTRAATLRLRLLARHNFPRCRSWRVPAHSTVAAVKQLQRPRFLALSGFGPRSLSTTKGACRVCAMLSLGQRDSSTADTRLPTKSVESARLRRW